MSGGRPKRRGRGGGKSSKGGRDVEQSTPSKRTKIDESNSEKREADDLHDSSSENEEDDDESTGSSKRGKSKPRKGGGDERKTELSTRAAGKEADIEWSDLTHVEKIRKATMMHCGVQANKKITMSHYELVIKHMSGMIARNRKSVSKGVEKDNVSKKEIEGHNDRLKRYLKTSIGKMSRIFFYPTNRVTNRVVENMRSEGIDHKCEFAVTVKNALYKKWPKRIDVEWMKPEKWKDLWEGKYGVSVRDESVEFLRKSRNNHSIRATATIGK